MVTTVATENAHPYMPRELNLPGYVHGSLSQSTILGVYGLLSLLVISLVWILSGRLFKQSKIDRLLMCWWAFTGLTHIILEVYFVFSPEFYKDKTGYYLAEIWKEYSKADSRYVARDSEVIVVEGITAVLGGPASLLAMYAIATGKSYSHVLQLAISLGHLYGDAVYFITYYLEGNKFAINSFYYYAYYIGANASWVVIPMVIAVRSWRKICAANQIEGQKRRKLA